MSSQVQANIPTSTLHNWKNRDVHQLFGLDAAGDFEKNRELVKAFFESKRLIEVAKAMFSVYNTYNQIISGISKKSNIFRDSKDTIIKTIESVRPALGFKRSMKAFGISYQQFYAWKKHIKCKKHDKVLCRRLNVRQLTQKEVDIIADYLQNPAYKYWNLSSIYYQILRNKAAFFSKTSFYKYANRLHIERISGFKRKIKSGIRANCPKQLLHMDVTIYRPLDHTRVYIYLLVDNYSRFIMNWKASLQYSAQISCRNLSEAYQIYDLKSMPPYIELITDGGSENKGEVDSFVALTQDNMKKLVAQSDIWFSNSMVEAVNKQIKYDYLFTRDFLDFEETENFLSFAIDEYNNKPHGSLFGLTPKEVFEGMIPDKNMFAEQIKQEAKKRKYINLNQDCFRCR